MKLLESEKRMSFGCLWLLTTNGAESLIWERKSDVNMWPGGNGSTYVVCNPYNPTCHTMSDCSSV